MHLLKAHHHRPSIGRYLGPDNRCPVCHVTFALRYHTLLHMPLMSNRAQEQFVRAAKSFCLVPLRTSRRTPSSLSSLRPVGFALWLGKWESLWVAQRTRKSSSHNGDCPPQPAKRLRWAPVLCLSLVAIAQPLSCLPGSWLSCGQTSSNAFTGVLSEKTTSVTAVSCARFLQASTLVGICHCPHLVLTSQRLKEILRKDVIFGGSRLRSAAQCVAWSTQPCHVCAQCNALLRSVCLHSCVVFPCVLTWSSPVPRASFTGSTPIRLSVAPTVRIGFISCSLLSWLACILSRRRSCARRSIWWFPRTYSFFWCCSIPLHL